MQVYGLETSMPIEALRSPAADVWPDRPPPSLQHPLATGAMGVPHRAGPLGSQRRAPLCLLQHPRRACGFPAKPEGLTTSCHRPMAPSGVTVPWFVVDPPFQLAHVRPAWCRTRTPRRRCSPCHRSTMSGFCNWRPSPAQRLRSRSQWTIRRTAVLNRLRALRPWITV